MVTNWTVWSAGMFQGTGNLSQVSEMLTNGMLMVY